MKVNAITPQVNKIAKKSVAIAAGVAIGIAAGALCKSSKPSQNTGIEYIINYSEKTSDTFTSKSKQKNHEFSNVNNLKNNGKTKHWFRAQNGPDKGSKFYRDSEYTFFGYYKD